MYRLLHNCHFFHLTAGYDTKNLSDFSNSTSFALYERTKFLNGFYPFPEVAKKTDLEVLSMFIKIFTLFLPRFQALSSSPVDQTLEKSNFVMLEKHDERQPLKMLVGDTNNSSSCIYQYFPG